jgi:hypothetical protein
LVTTLVDPLADSAEAIAALLLGTLERGTPFQGDQNHTRPRCPALPDTSDDRDIIS